MTFRALRVIPGGACSAVAAAEQRWAETAAGQLTCLEQAHRDLVAALARAAAIREGVGWATRFVARISRFTVWSGLVFASAIGAVRWTMEMRVLGWSAGAVALAYLVALAVAIPACWAKGRRVWSHLNRVSGRAGSSFLVLYAAFLLSMAILYGVVNTFAFHVPPGGMVRPQFYLREFGAFAAVTGLGSLLTYLVVAYAYGVALQTACGTPAVNSAAELAATVVTAWLPSDGRSHSLPGNARLDSGLLGVLGCAAALDLLAHGQQPADTSAVRSVIAALELAAADLEMYAVDRVPRTDPTTRRIARMHGTQLAAVLRDAKVSIARAIGPQDLAATAVDLAGFLLTWAQQGGINLAMVDTSAPTVPASFWPRVASRIWKTVLLGAAAVALPFLLYHGHQAAAAGLRTALIIAAVMTLATGSVPTWDTIGKIESTIPENL